MTDAEKKPCCAAEPAEKDTAPSCCRRGFGRDEIRAAIARYQDNYEEY